MKSKMYSLQLLIMTIDYLFDRGDNVEVLNEVHNTANGHQGGSFEMDRRANPGGDSTHV